MFELKKQKRSRKVLFWAAVTLVVVFVIYIIHAASVVTDRMAGKKWDLPSRIFGASPVIYPGAPIHEKDLAQYLTGLGYRPTKSRPVQAGQFQKDSSGYEIGVRKFRDSTGEHAELRLELRISGGRVDQMYSRKGEGGEELFTATLEPEMIAEIFPPHREQRKLVRLNEVPEALKNAIVMMEDRSFYTHHGVSFRGIFRAIYANLRGRRLSQGGSTLTQQLMKNFFLTPERTLSRKVRELVMTVITEIFYSKEEILEAYLNEIYLGQRGATSIHGFGEAARFYFSKEVSNLSLGEQAMLAGLISSPGRFSPYRDLKLAKERRDLVLKVLFDNQKITPTDYREAMKEKLQPRGITTDDRRAPYFIDQVRNEIVDRFDETTLQSDGLEIYTTLDPSAQRLAEAAVQNGVKALSKKVPNVQVALIAIHPRTGAVKAMVGGRNYKESQFNRVTQSKRQIGSLVKPFLAAAALGFGPDQAPPVATAATLLLDEPTTFSVQGKDWAPKNYDGKYFGKVTLRSAVEHSLNVATVNLASRMQFSFIEDQLRKYGFEGMETLPSMVLGSMHASPWEVARAYSAFPNGGALTTPQSVAAIVSNESEYLEQKSMQFDQVMTTQTAYLVTNILTGVVERGTAIRVSSAGLHMALAGKTGTTNENRDSWFAGFSPSLLTVVWVGHDDDTKTGLTGSSGALPIWIDFMREMSKRLPEEEFAIPSDIDWFEIDRELGCLGSGKEMLREAFLHGTQPPKCP
jgi:penicillin-binding protein 1B